MAEDRWEQELHEATYGGLEIHVLRMADGAGTELVPHEYPHVDGANLEPMGRRRRITSATLKFFALTPDDDYFSRFQAFELLAHDGEPHTFVHPLTGAYEAFVGQFDFSVDPNERDTVTVDVTFEEATTDVAIFQAGPGVAPEAALEQLRTTSAEVDGELAEQGLSSTVATDSIAKADQWSELNPRVVRLQMAAITRTIETETNRLQLATDVKRYGLYVAMIRLQHAVRKAALAFLQTTPRIVEITVQHPSPLLVVAAGLYGAAEASERAAQIGRMNKIRNPARIEAGTSLKVPAASRRSGQ